MQLAVLGTGRMGAFRAQALAAHPAVESVFVGSHDRQRAHNVAAPLGSQSGTVEEALAQEIDALVISTVTAEHPSQIEAGAERGIPILCEKPIALSLADTQASLEVVAQAGVEIQVGFQRRFDAGFLRARDLLAAGALGTLYSIRICAHDHEPSDERFISTSGGIFRDLHVHDFDMARWLTGLEVVEVFATGAVRKWERFARFGDIDTSAVVMTLEGGVPVLVSGSRHDPVGYDFRTEILGSKDSIAVGVDARTPIRSVQPDDVPDSTAKPYRGFLDRFSGAFQAETAAFVELVLGRGPNQCPGEAALEALRVAIACDRSRAEHRPVRVGKIENGP